MKEKFENKLGWIIFLLVTLMMTVSSAFAVRENSISSGGMIEKESGGEGPGSDLSGGPSCNC